MDLSELNIIKRLALVAMFSDDELMDKLVLKGGNALDLIHHVALRASRDLDFSLDGEFSASDVEGIQSKVLGLLQRSFRPEGYEVFDLTFKERPRPARITPIDPALAFWGGYRIEFKLIETAKYLELEGKLDDIRKFAAIVGGNNSTKFQIEISKFEYCAKKQEVSLDGYTIYVYSPEMIVCEKIRAICQQMPEYGAIVKSSSQSARARDFVDIHTVIEAFGIVLGSIDNLDLLKQVFAAKQVPLRLIGLIPDVREYHRQDFDEVKLTVLPGQNLEDFDFYFNFVVHQTQVLKTLWEM